jgi:hypothetical protein
MNASIARCYEFAIIVSIVTMLVSWAHATDGGMVPRFEIESIPNEIAPKTGAVVFGYLVVYENRDISAGKTIRLPVMIGKCRSDNTRPDPIIFTVGGPGVISTQCEGNEI